MLFINPLGSVRKFGDMPTKYVCSMYLCDTLSLEWEHQWSKTISTYIIEKEDIELLQDTNSVAYAAATFNSFDTSVFSDDGENLPEDYV